MKQLELFAGIGGFGLAGRWAGIESAVQVEWNPFCQKVLKKNFPNAEQHGDITTFDGTPYRGAIDIISGGFPCQPYSTAGKRLGKEDDRHLWPEMLRVIREVAPRWVVGENVRGIVSWNGGMVFDEVQTDLEAAGYEVQAFILPACGVNAPHRRDRVWVIAYAAGDGHQLRELGKDRQEASSCESKGNKRERVWNDRRGTGESWATTNAERIRQQRQVRPERQEYSASGGYWEASWANNAGRWPTQSPVCGGNDGIPNRMDRIAALGNAIVPQVAFQIFKAIQEYEKTTP